MKRGRGTTPVIVKNFCRRSLSVKLAGRSSKHGRQKKNNQNALVSTTRAFFIFRLCSTQAFSLPSSSFQPIPRIHSLRSPSILSRPEASPNCLTSFSFRRGMPTFCWLSTNSLPHPLSGRPICLARWKHFSALTMSPRFREIETGMKPGCGVFGIGFNDFVQYVI